MFMINQGQLQRSTSLDKHNMNLSVLIFLKTYVCKHESNHIEPKPTQKNCSSRSNCLLTNTYYIERFYTIPIRQVGWAFDILLLNFFHSKEPLLKLTTMYNNCHLSQKEKKKSFQGLHAPILRLSPWDLLHLSKPLHCLNKN